MNKYFLLIFIFLLHSNLLFSKELKKVSLQLSWFDQFQFAGYYMAKEKGFYEDYGLDVEIRPFDFGINVSDEVNEKKVDFAVDRETLVLQRVAGKKVVALYALFQKSPLVLLSLKDSKINKIKDFLNKRIMTTIDDASEVSIKSMILSKGLKIENLNFIKHTHNIMDLVNKNTDVISAYLSKTPYDLQQMKVDYNIFNPSDYGFDMYSDFLFTNEDLIKNDISTVLAFKEASLKGWEYAYSNIEETANYIYKYLNSQKISLDALIFEGKVLKELSYLSNIKLGEIRPEKLQRIYDLYNVMGLTPKKIDLKSFVLYKDYSQILNFTDEEKKYILSKKEVKMCILPNLKPYTFIHDGVFKGVVADYIKLIEEKTKLDFSLVKTNSVEETFSFLQNGKCEVIPSLHNIKERKDYLSFTDPYFNASIGLVTRNEISFIEDISIIKDKKIGIPIHASYYNMIKEKYPNNNFIAIENISEGLEKVENKEIFAYVNLLYPLWNTIQDNQKNQVKISAKFDFSIPVSISTINKEDLLHSILSKSVKSISKEEMTEILNKWIIIEYQKEFDYELLLKVVIIFALILIIFVYRHLVLRKMNEDLQKRVKEKTKELQKINLNLEKRIKEEVDANLQKDRLLAKQSKMVAMGEMIQNIAHQWRQPLSIISTGASGLKLQKDVKGKIDDDLMDSTLITIVNTSLKLSSTIDDFMHFFKPSKEKKLFGISDMISRTLNIFNYNLQDNKIKIEKDIEDSQILSYESQFIQVLTNLLTNSKEAFLERNIENRVIFIESKKKNGFLIIKVKDSAGGIKQDIIEKIFEPYFTTKHQYQGTGIGLYMCQEIIDKHMNGTINVENVKYEYDGHELKGSMFTIKIRVD